MNNDNLTQQRPVIKIEEMYKIYQMAEKTSQTADINPVKHHQNGNRAIPKSEVGHETA
jgi:hypothetical protein